MIRLFLSGNADAGVGDRKSNHVARAVQRFEVIVFVSRRRTDAEHDLSFFGKLKRIGKQIHKNLLEPLVVSANRFR